ncbi:hypothetical protein HOY80DRAFT_1109643 [Tuber brumale]|nr:hypothetical protein HOY80DRAFT_1109643 [Tuber brumale]
MSSSLGDERAIEMVLDAVDYPPLVIVGATAFLRETSSSLSEYWRILQNREGFGKRLLSQDLLDSDIHRGNATESVSSTHFVTFERIAEQEPAAADLLRLIAFLDRQNIPEELLTRSNLPGMDNPIELRTAIGKLICFSMITKKPSDRPLYELHRPVQQSIRGYLAPDEVNRWRNTALEVMRRMFPRYKYQSRHVCSLYLPHALSAIEGYYNGAEIQIRRCIAFRGEVNGESESRVHLSELSLLGSILLRQEKYDESGEIHRRVLKNAMRILANSHWSTLDSANSLVEVLRCHGKYGEAEMMHRSTLETAEKEFLEPAEAEELHRQILEFREKTLGPEDPYTLHGSGDLASVLGLQGKHTEAEVIQRQILRVKEELFNLRSDPRRPVRSRLLAAAKVQRSLGNR